MAINIGNDAVMAVKDLRGNPDFHKLIDALDIIVQGRIYASIAAPVDLRIQQTAHADGMRELVDSMRAVLLDKLPSQLAKPASPKFRGQGSE